MHGLKLWAASAQLYFCIVSHKTPFVPVLCPALTKLVLAPSFGAGAKAFGSGLPGCALDIPNPPQTTAAKSEVDSLHLCTAQKRIQGTSQGWEGQDMFRVRLWVMGMFQAWELQPAVAETPATDLSIPELKTIPSWIQPGHLPPKLVSGTRDQQHGAVIKENVIIN